MDQEIDHQAQEELLSEQLTGDELREVLERLGSTEFALNDYSTVRDVVEGTGADPVSIGRALAEVRKQDFEERFASAFGEHEKRIHELEERPSINVEGVDLSSAVEKAIDAKRRKDEQAIAAKRQKEQLEYDRILENNARVRMSNNRILAIVVGTLALLYLVGTSLTQALFGPDTVTVTPANGFTISKTRSGEYDVRRSDGTHRPASDYEKDMVDREEAKVRHWNKPVRGAPLPPTGP